MELDEKALRKAWLKQYFASFEYHEQMLWNMHEWIKVIRRALVRAEADHSELPPGRGFKTVAEEAHDFRRRLLPLIERSDSYGKHTRSDWESRRHTASYVSVSDFNRYLISEQDAFSWMTEAEAVELGKYWRPMSQMAQNIQYTVDRMWFSKLRQHDDDLLNEEITGPITYPPDWREQLLGPQAALLQSEAPRATAGRPVPQSGLWRAVDARGDELRVKAGETLPDLSSAYGLTVWQRIAD